MEHAIETFRQQLGRRDAVRNARVADLALRPDQALGEGRLGDQERPGDLGCCEAAERPQREGDARIHRERRMATREDEAESIIGDGHVVLWWPRVDRAQVRFDRGVAREHLGLLGQSFPTTDAIDRPVPRRRRDPRSWVVRHATLRPGFERRDERVLDGFLGEVEVAQHADQRRDGAALLLAKDAIDDVVGGLGRGQTVTRRRAQAVTAE